MKRPLTAQATCSSRPLEGEAPAEPAFDARGGEEGSAGASPSRSRAIGPRRNRVVLWASVAVALWCGLAASPVSAAEPYQLDVVLDIARHRLLTDVFKAQVRRELEDGLRTAFGDLVKVKVVTEHKRLAEMKKFGLSDAAFKGWNELSGVKTHFVLIDYADGQYEIRARQHDGYTGLPSPVVRRERTIDRPFVARLATLLIDRDFGIVGSIAPGASPKNLTVNLMGSGASVPPDRWVKKGDVFLVVSISADNRGYRVLDAMVLAEDAPDKGAFKGKLFDRKARAGKASKLLFMRVHTIKTPLRLRLVQEQSSAPADNLGVVARRHGFVGEDNSRIQGFTDREGMFSTEKKGDAGVFDRAAFVTVDLRPKAAIIPVPLVDENPVTVKVSTQAPSRSRLLTENKELWEESAYEWGQVQQALFRELKEMGAKPSVRGRAMQRAKEGLEASRAARRRLEQQRADLVKEAQALPATLDYSIGDQWLKFLAAGDARLEAYVAEQERILKEENDPKRQEYLTLVQQGKLEEGRAEYGKALDIYQKALTSGFADDALKSHVADLKSRWEPKNAEHQKARNFVYNVWPGVDLVKDPKSIETARAALAVFVKEKDTIGPQKLYLAALGHVGKLEAQKKQQDDVNEEDRKVLAVIADVSKDLKKLITEVLAVLPKGEK
jgi:hypothetical protein